MVVELGDFAVDVLPLIIGLVVYVVAKALKIPGLAWFGMLGCILWAIYSTTASDPVRAFVVCFSVFASIREMW